MKKMKREMEEWKPGKGLLGVHLQSSLKCQHQHRVILVYSCRARFGRLTLGHRYNPATLENAVPVCSSRGVFRQNH